MKFKISNSNPVEIEKEICLGLVKDKDDCVDLVIDGCPVLKISTNGLIETLEVSDETFLKLRYLGFSINPRLGFVIRPYYRMNIGD